jgi:hypothetical protein
MKKAFLFSVCFGLFSSVSFALGNFNDTKLASLLSTGSEGLIYTLSTKMPLSIEGVGEALKVSANLKLPITFLVDKNDKEADVLAALSSKSFSISVEYLDSSVLVASGMNLHFPSLAIYQGKKLVGAPIAGFKSANGYAVLISGSLGLKLQSTFLMTKQTPVPRSMSYFYKPLYGTDYFMSGDSSPNYLFNIRTDKIFDIPNDDWGDPSGTPDGEFVTLLGFDGVAWFLVSDILAGKTTKLLKDPGLTKYQSLGMYKNSTGETVYRMVGAVTSSTSPTGLIFRDFKKTVDAAGKPSVSPIMSWAAICASKNISIPMISKTGYLLSGRESGVMKVFRIGSDGKDCTEVANTGQITGKADFSMDDDELLYVAPSASGNQGVYLFSLSKNTATLIYEAAASVSLSFPGFYSTDLVSVLDDTNDKIVFLERTLVIP